MSGPAAPRGSPGPLGGAARGRRCGDCVQWAAGKEPRLDRLTVEKPPKQRKNKVHKGDGGLSLHTTAGGDNMTQSGCCSDYCGCVTSVSCVHVDLSGFSGSQT